MRKIFLSLLLLASSSVAFAQTDEIAKEIESISKERKKHAEETVDSTKNWKFSGAFSLTASQTTLVNWAAGGDEQIGANAMANFMAHYRKDRHSWKNDFYGSYGLLKILGDGKDNQLRKTDDKMNFSSKYGYAATKKIFYSGLFDYKSQFANGYKYNDDGTKEFNSQCWSPLYLTYTVGMDFQVKPNIAIYVSPFGGKTTIVRNDYLSSIGAFGVDTLKHARSEFGLYVKFDANFDLCKSVNLATNATFFNNYKDGLGDEVDIDWNLIISIKINKFLAFNITSEFIYDEDITIADKDGIPHNSLGQFKNVTGLGLTFKF